MNIYFFNPIGNNKLEDMEPLNTELFKSFITEVFVTPAVKPARILYKIISFNSIPFTASTLIP
jgi:hypothetical protein